MNKKRKIKKPIWDKHLLIMRRPRTQPNETHAHTMTLAVHTMCSPMCG